MLEKNGISRRQFLKLAGLSGATLGLGASLGGLIAACGGEATTTTAAAGAATTAGVGTTVSTAAAGPATKTGLLVQQGGDLGNVFWNRVFYGFNEAAKALGNEVQSLDIGNSAPTQITQIETLGARGAAAVNTFCIDNAATPQVITTATKQNILIANMYSNGHWVHPLDPEYEGKYVLFQMGPQWVGYYQVAKSVFQAMGGKGAFINCHGVEGNDANSDRRLGMFLAMREFPDIQMVAAQNAGESRVLAAPVIENLLSAHPEATGVLCHNDDSAIAVLNTCKERNRPDIKVGAADAIPEFLDALQNGTNATATLAIHPLMLGGYAAVRLFDALNGVKVDPLEYMLWPSDLVIDTAEAAAKYDEVINKPDPSSFDWKKMSRALHPEDWTLPYVLQPWDCTYYWQTVGGYAQPEGYKGLPQAYQDSLANNFDKVKQMYVDHYKGGPLDQVVPLTTHKKTSIEIMDTVKVPADIRRS